MPLTRLPRWCATETDSQLGPESESSSFLVPHGGQRYSIPRWLAGGLPLTGHTPTTTQHDRSQTPLGRQPARPARPRQLGPLDAPGTNKPGTGYFGWWVQVGGSKVGKLCPDPCLARSLSLSLFWREAPGGAGPALSARTGPPAGRGGGPNERKNTVQTLPEWRPDLTCTGPCWTSVFFICGSVCTLEGSPPVRWRPGTSLSAAGCRACSAVCEGWDWIGCRGGDEAYQARNP